MSALIFTPTSTALPIYRANFAGHVIGARKVGDVWEVTIDPQTPLMERPFDLRSTYSCADLPTAVNAAMCAILDFGEHAPTCMCLECL